MIPDAADGPVLECVVSFRRGAHGCKHLRAGRTPPPPPPAGRIPRVSRLVALAVKLDGQVRAGQLRDWADVARLGRVTRARASQIANLTLLAPDVIEAVLHLPLVVRGRDPITERHLRPLASEPSWAKQRGMWRELTRSIGEVQAKT